jgi:hypothetical protein
VQDNFDSTFKLKVVHVIIHTKDDDENLPRYREVIKEAMKRLNILPCWDEVILLPQKNAFAKLTFDGSEAWNEKGNMEFSVEYLVDQMKKQLHPNKKSSWGRILQKNISFLLALFIAFSPKCPICWAAWLSALGLISANSIPYRPWYLYVSIVLITLNIVALFLLNRNRKLKPLAINLAGALLIIINRFTVNNSFLVILGGVLLIAGAAWSSLPAWMKRSGFGTSVAN